ncbi:hypothetical protein [Luteolibacter sp. Populi]|uniref:hypothetical protein n=1 Tax=Luteolibacter sp. Populi TaxID=3230487 RepID=UPI00346574D5
MKRGVIGWMLVLVATHAAVFLLARGDATAGSAVEGGSAAGVEGAAKVRDREDDNGRSGSAAGGHALMWRELLAREMSREEFSKAREVLLRDWLRQDLRGAMDCLYAPGTWASLKDVARMLEEETAVEMARQPREAMEWIGARRFGSNSVAVFDLWLGAIEESDQHGLLLELLPQAPVFAKAEMLQSACETADARQMEVIRGQLSGEFPDRRERDLLVSSYAERAVVLVKGDLAAVLKVEEDPEVRKGLAEQWAVRELVDLPKDEGVAGLLQLPADLRADGLGELVGRGRPADLAGTVELLDSVGRHGLWEEVTAKEREATVRAAVDLAVEEHCLPGVAFAELSRITRPELREIALDQLGDQVGVPVRVEELAEVAGGLPPGRDRDAFLKGVLKRVGEWNSMYEGIRALISDDGVRKGFGEGK